MVWKVLRTAVIIAFSLVIGSRAASTQEPKIYGNHPIALIADNITYDSEGGVLIATGSVEVYHGERTLTADQITYNERTGRIGATGDIVLRDPQGTTVFGDIVDLDTKLTDGIIHGARSILGNQARVAAVEGQRFNERYNVLSKAVYSPCEICTNNHVPLWRIRARRIIHDNLDKQVHYENAWLDVFGVPLFWTPYFRHPAPEVDRASGFLTPSLRQSNNYGFGLQTPYYLIIDDQSDLTVTPFFTTEEGILGIFEYRNVLSSGNLFFGGSMTSTNFSLENRKNKTFEGHIHTRALFDGPDDLKLGWDAQATSEDSYLRYFDISDRDTLKSQIFAKRYRRDGFFDMRFIGFQSLRDQKAEKVPLLLPDIDIRRDHESPYFGGTLGFTVSSRSLFRKNTTNNTRISLGIDWKKKTILPFGLALKGFAEMRGDYFMISKNSNINDTKSFRPFPLAGIEARFPLIRETGGTKIHVVEPIAQAVITPYGSDDSDSIINEDSRVSEFDEINLFDHTRFSGLDTLEEGPRLNLGLKYHFITKNWLDFNVTGGRILRIKDANEFLPETGLTEQQSDWVLGWQTSYDDKFALSHRMRLADDGSLSRNNLAGQAEYGRLRFQGQYTFLEANPDIGQDDEREEISFAAGFRLSPTWSIRGSGRQDLEIGEFVGISSKITYAHECCKVDFFISRRFTKSINVPPSTSLGIQINLITLGIPDSNFSKLGGISELDASNEVMPGPDR